MQPFEGILPHLERRYRETESNYVRDDLAQYLSNAACDACGGSRLNEISRHVRVKDKTIADITRMSIGDAESYYQGINLEGAKGEIADKIFKEIRERLHFLVSVVPNYLSLARSAETLSGGEAQRIRLASQIGAGLMGVMYVLDEPSIGLHQRDNDRLLQTLIRLRDLGNTVLVVEHDEDAIRAADHIIDIYLVLACMVVLSLLKVRMMSWLNMPTRSQVNIFQANSKLKCQNSELNHLNLKKN